MAKRSSIRVAEYELDDLFEAFGIFEGLAAGRLRETLERGLISPSRRCSLGGASYHTRVWDETGALLARIHYVRCVFGHLIGVWPSVLFFEEITLYRQGHQRRPAGEVVGRSVS